MGLQNKKLWVHFPSSDHVSHAISDFCGKTNIMKFTKSRWRHTEELFYVYSLKRVTVNLSCQKSSLTLILREAIECF